MNSPTDHVTRVRKLVAAFNKQDTEVIVQQLADNVTWSRGDGQALLGRSVIAAALKNLFVAFPKAVLKATNMLSVEPKAVVLEWTLEGAHVGAWRLPGEHGELPPTGRSMRIVGADLFGFNNSGEIESDEARIDVASLLAQIGATPDAAIENARFRKFAERYTAAWCSQNPNSVAECYATTGTLTVNGGAPAVGRQAIADVAQGFMTTFPDLEVRMEGLFIQGERAVYRWTLRGTNSAPGGTGQRVRIGGFEVWYIGADDLITGSRGYFDSAAYAHQLEHGIATPGDAKPA